MAPLPQEKAVLRASYTSSSGSTKFEFPISAPLPSTNSQSVKEKTVYLSELRGSTKNLQDDINIFLTQKMEEDKAAAGGKSTLQTETAGRTEEVEEENYGEEGLKDENTG